VIPAGALPAGTVVSAYPITNTAPLVAQVPAGQSYVVSLAVTWEALDGSSPTATAPITLTITDAGIVAGDTVYEVTSSGLIVVGTASANGVVSITFTNDPTFVVAAALVSQSPISITSLNGEPGTALSLVTSGGQGTGAVSFTVTNGTAIGCAISGTSLSASSAGTCVVTVTKAADATYLSASSTASVTFRPPAPTQTGAPTLTVAPPPKGISILDLGTPVSGVAANNATTTVALKLSTGTGAPTATSSIVIPAGALPAGTVVSAYPITNTAPLVAQVPAGQSYVVSLAVTWEALDGSSPTATAPITLTITDAGIVAGDTVYEVTSSGLIVVGTASANGVVSITFTNDPTFVVAAALVSQSPISITSLNGEPGTALSLVTSGGQGTGAVSFTVTNGTAIGCAISGTSLSASSAGTCVVTVTKAADATYLSASSTASVTFRKAKVVPSASPPVARASQMSVVFAFYSSALSNSTRSALIDLSRKLARGASVTIVGYADFDIPLATSRAVAVKKFLQRLVPIKVKIKIVTNLPARKVDVINTAT
jgi:hypothetical protein